MDSLDTRPGLLLRGRKLLGRIRYSWEVNRYDVFSRAVTPADAAFEDPPGYRFFWAEPRDVLRFDPFHTEMELEDRRAGAERLSIGHRCAAAASGGLAVFTMWLNPRNINIPGDIKRRLKPDQAFIYKAFTSPEHRGRKLYENGMRFVLHNLRLEEKRELIGYAHVKKAISRKGLEALGFEKLGRYYALNTPIYQRAFVTPALAACFPERVARTSTPRAAGAPADR